MYLLHGYSGNYAQWIHHAPQLKQKADELQMIFICPDGGYGSWYLNSPVDTTFQYETFISKELISYIDANYKTIADKFEQHYNTEKYDSIFFMFDVIMQNALPLEKTTEF